jgi:hypothetical protein
MLHRLAALRENLRALRSSGSSDPSIWLRFGSVVFLLFSAALGIFVFVKILPAIGYVFHVGLTPAAIAMRFFFTIGYLLMIPMSPLYNAMI